MLELRFPRKFPPLTQLIHPVESRIEWSRFGLLAAVTARFS